MYFCGVFQCYVRYVYTLACLSQHLEWSYSDVLVRLNRFTQLYFTELERHHLQCCCLSSVLTIVTSNPDLHNWSQYNNCNTLALYPIWRTHSISSHISHPIWPADRVMANPVLSADILQEAVPGNIRKAEHFVAFLKKVRARDIFLLHPSFMTRSPE